MQHVFINPAGFVRVSDLRGLGVPFAISTIWQKVAQGEFPAPVKMGHVTAWKIGDVLDWLTAQSLADQQAPEKSRGQRLTAARLAKRQAAAALGGDQ